MSEGGNSENDIRLAKAKKEGQSEAEKKWLHKNGLYLLRLCIAGLVVLFFGAPLAIKFNEFIKPIDTKDFVSTVVSKHPFPQSNKDKDSSGEVKQEVLAASKIISETSSAPRVWVYGLRIFGLLTALGGVLWAVVALCRE